MRFLSVCSGIEAASHAWEPLGWRAIGFAEIDAAASRVLAYHYPDVPNFGDFTTIDAAGLGPVDLLVGGTPCQAFSNAGRRLSLGDARGNLSLAYAVLAHELARSAGARWAVWENVPGVLSTKDNAFGCLLAALVGADDPLRLPPRVGRWPDEGMVEGPRARAAWRIFDAQYFGLAQRRRRVFVVVGLGAWADPAAVLFEPKSLRWHSSPRGKARQSIAGTLTASAARRGGVPAADAGAAASLVPVAFGAGNCGPIDVAATLTAHRSRHDFESEIFVAHTLRGEGFDASEDGTGRCIPLVPVSHPPAIAFDARQSGVLVHGDRSQALDTQFPGPAIASAWGVRRLMPVECERLQGFRDGYAAIPGAADGPRYKQLGNSKAVKVVRWIGERIAAQEAMQGRKSA